MPLAAKAATYWPLVKLKSNTALAGSTQLLVVAVTVLVPNAIKCAAPLPIIVIRLAVIAADLLLLVDVCSVANLAAPVESYS